MQSLKSSSILIERSTHKLSSLIPRFSFRPFKAILDQQILGNVHRYNQDIFMNNVELKKTAERVYNMHNSQDMIFLFRLMKVFSLTQQQLETIIEAQSKKYSDYHELRKASEPTQPIIAAFHEYPGEQDESQQQASENQDQTKGTSNLYVNIFKTKAELKDVIWMLRNMQMSPSQLRFYHIFINKGFNKLLYYAMSDLSQINCSADQALFDLREAYNSVDRSKVTSEQMCLLLLLFSQNELYENMPDIFEGELEGIFLPLSGKPIGYTFAKFINRLGLNSFLNQDDTSMNYLQSNSVYFHLIQPGTVVLSSYSMQLFLFDLKQDLSITGEQQKIKMDVSFFSLFNIDNIIQDLSLDEIFDLVTALIEHDTGDVAKESVKKIIALLIHNSMGQVEDFKIINHDLLRQLNLIVAFEEYAVRENLLNLFHGVVSGIIRSSAQRAIVSVQFAEYIVKLLEFCPSTLVDFYPLFELFFMKQNINSINYKQLLIVYEAMAETGVDYEDYLKVVHSVFSAQKYEIEQNPEELEQILGSASQLKDQKVLSLFGNGQAGIVREPKKKHSLPLDIEYLSDLSEDEDEIEGVAQQNQSAKK